MNQDQINHIRQWLDKAEHDLIAAKLILDQSPLICFKQNGIELNLLLIVTLQ